MFRTTSILVLALALTACASSAMITGTPRAPIDPAQVRVYYGAPPGHYEEIALLESNSGSFTYGEQNKTNSVLAKLRGEAAKLGANGVLFRGSADGYGGGGVSVGAGGGRVGGHGFSSGGIGLDISPRQKSARGIAIYVDNPPPPGAPMEMPPEAPMPAPPPPVR